MIKERNNTNEIKSFFNALKKDVVTFIGYSQTAYEDEAVLLQKAGKILDEFDPTKTIINIGTTQIGIGAVYRLAKEKGFMTTGIVSSLANNSKFELSPFVDHIFFVEDLTWGGYLKGSGRLSPTSALIVETSSVLIGLGGGEIARIELEAAKSLGKDVRVLV